MPTIRTANCQIYIYLTLITSTFSYFCSEETSKGCAVRHSPYIVVTLITSIQKGEFEAAHFRPPKGRIKRCCINQLYIYLTLITITFSYFCSEETLKGCTVRHSPYIIVTPISNIQKGEFEAGHARRPPRKSPLYLRGWYKGLSFGL